MEEPSTFEDNIDIACVDEDLELRLVELVRDESDSEALLVVMENEVDVDGNASGKLSEISGDETEEASASEDLVNVSAVDEDLILEIVELVECRSDDDPVLATS